MAFFTVGFRIGGRFLVLLKCGSQVLFYGRGFLKLSEKCLFLHRGIPLRVIFSGIFFRRFGSNIRLRSFLWHKINPARDGFFIRKRQLILTCQR